MYASPQGICVAILNPELESYTAVRGADCKPLLLSDFSSVFHLNTDAYVSAPIHTSLDPVDLHALCYGLQHKPSTSMSRAVSAKC
jgi:hypothetical protein